MDEGKVFVDYPQLLFSFGELSVVCWNQSDCWVDWKDPNYCCHCYLTNWHDCWEVLAVVRPEKKGVEQKQE